MAERQGESVEVATNSSYLRAPDANPSKRAAELVAAQFATISRRTDHLFAWLLVLQFVAGIVAAVELSTPQLDVLSWPRIDDLTVWAAIIGGITSGIPLAMIWQAPGTPLSRHIVAVAQMIWPFLLIHFTGGRMETHFHVFASLAILACYRDWRVLLTATLVVIAADSWRIALFGPLEAEALFRDVERLGFVLFEVGFLGLAIRLSTHEMWSNALGQARLEESNRRLDAEFTERTRNYRQYTERLERIHHELNRKAQQLQEARAAADQANAAKSHFVATVSHEIRTPLTAILGFADVLATSLADPEANRAARTIKRNGEFLLQLVDDILDLSRIEAGRLAVESLPCSPRQIVDEVVQLMRVRADAKGLPLVVEFDCNVPEAISSDPLRLRQILLNLVSNALKFSSRGEVRIHVLQPPLPDADRIQFDVQDQGIGLTHRQIDNLFHPFSQGHESTARTHGGSGLGLSISKRLANLLGGDITVQSVAGQGSTFSATVAINQPTSDHPPDAARRSAAKSLSADRKPLLKGCRVLVADDSRDNQELVAFVLQKSGALVTTVDNGADAVHQALLAQAADVPFDVILMDVQMPRVDGFSATEELRSQGYPGPIVALTAHSRPEDLQRCRRSGCDACLTKPIDESLLTLIAQFVRGRERSEAPAV